MKFCVIGCFHEGTKLRSSVRWCVEHCPCDARPPSTSRRSRSRSRARVPDEGHQTAAEEVEDGYEDDEDNGTTMAQTLLREAADAGIPQARTRKRPPSRSPGHTPKAGINKHLAKIGMLDSPGVDVGSGLLEKFMEKYAMSRDEGIQEDQVRARLCQEHLMTNREMLTELIREAEDEQGRGQRGLTRFLNCWRRAAEQDAKRPRRNLTRIGA